MSASTSTASALPANRWLAGAIAICAAVGIASTTDALVKLLSGGYPVHEVNALRCLVTLPLAFAYAAYDGGLGQLATRRWVFMCARGLMLALGNISFYLAIAAMPLADAVAIYFTMPFFVAGLMSPFLGERVRLHRWIAILVGFAGVIVMIRPGGGLFQPAAFFALASAFFYGTGQAMARPLAGIRPSVIAVYQASVYLTVALALAAVFGSGAFAGSSDESFSFLTRGWIMPGTRDLLILAGLGLSGVILMPLFAFAYKAAEPAFVAPFEYTAMFWAVLWGVLGFGDWPDQWTLGGAAIVIAAGLFMLRMDRKFR